MAIDSPPTLDLSKYIDTQFFGDRPHIRGRRIWVVMIAGSAATHHWDVAELAYQFTLSESEVLAALLYYQEHKDEIDAQEAEDQAARDEAYRLYGKRD
jgi:uncharacterized protein (DUF433 family)